MNPTEQTAWHALSADEAVERLKTSVKAGLSDAEATSRRARYGLNVLPAAKKRGPLMRFLQQFNSVLVYVLLAAGFVKAMLGLWVDSSIILAVVIVNGLLGFLQEGRAEKSLDSIRNMLSSEARTLRNGRTAMIPAETLVPGDIVFLESGDKIPADVRLVEVKNLRTEEAALTGESVPSDKSIAPVQDKATVGDRSGMAYSGTLVVSGRATGIVVGTGSDTELGRINQMLAGVSELETPLLLQIKKFGYAITAIILIISAVTFVYGHLIRDIPFVKMFQAATGIAVSMIPEGLPALITITLAIGVQRMAARNAIVRRLPAVETLGAVARICSDKTGTLTLMEMMVVSAAITSGTLQVTGQGYANEGEALKDGAPVGKDPVLELMGRVSALCNDAELRNEDGVWKVEGDPTEGALYPFAAKLGVEREKARAAYPRLDVIPFESDHQFMATLNSTPEGGEILLVKGAPEVDPRPLRPAGGRFRPTAAGSRLFRPGVRHVRRARRARAGAGVAARSGPQDRKLEPGRSAEEPHSARPCRSPRSAAQGSDRGGQGMPRRRHPGDDDHRRPQDHRGGDRQDARYRRRQDRGHRRRSRRDGHGDASGDGARTSMCSPAQARSTNCAWSRRSRPTSRSWP